MTDRLNAFHTKHDRRVYVPQRITEALARLAADTEHGLWKYETEMPKYANVSSNDLAAAREEFAAFVVTVSEAGKPRHVWCGTAEIANKFRAVPGAR